MSVDFKELLSVPVDSAKRPPTKPAGTYHAHIREFKYDTSRDKKTPYVRFTFNNITPGADIPAQMLVDDEGAAIDLSKWTPYKDFYLTNDSKYRLREFLESIFGKDALVGRPFDEVIAESKGSPVIISATLAPSRDGGTEMYTNIDKCSGLNKE